MTTPNPASQFMRSLDRHPEIEEELRRRLLTEELLNLPNAVAQLASAVSQMTATFDRRLASLEGRFDKADGRFDGMGGRFDSIDSRLDMIDRLLDSIESSNYERMAARRAKSILSRYLHLSQIELLQSPLHESAPHLVEIVNDALRTHKLMASEADDLDEAGIIVSANDHEGNHVQIVTEPSATISDSDIDEARRRARILERITGTPTTAAVIGAVALDEKHQHAEAAGVVILTLTRGQTTEPPAIHQK